MAGQGGSPQGDRLLAGLFGTFQSTIQNQVSTADLWSALRVNAATWFYQAGGGGPLPPAADLEAQGARILSQQGVGIQQVNQYRALSNQWNQAKQSLQALDENEQLTARNIFRPPWATSGKSGVEPQYRARILWQVTDPQGNPFQVRGTYQLQAPLTNIADVISQARALVGTEPGSDTPVGSVFGDPADIEIEQV